MSRVSAALLLGALVAAACDHVSPTAPDDPAAAGQSTRLALNPTATFLRTDSVDAPADPLIVDLAPWAIPPGGSLLLTRTGDFAGSIGSTFADEEVAILGLFSSTRTLLGPGNRIRVPDAIGGVGSPVGTGTTWFEGHETDLAEDFWIGTATRVAVPPGAKFLFIGVSDSYFRDNIDPDADLMVEISTSRAVTR